MSYFTPDEANALLPRIRPLVERVVEQRRALATIERRRLELTARIAGNGGDLTPGELSEVDAELMGAAAALAALVEEIHELGVQVKDLELGLVDFPSLREGAEVFLCWRLGEDEIEFWHGLDEGYAGRKLL